MKDIINEVISKIGFTETLKAIINKGFEKVAISAVAATIWDIGTIFAVFVFLAIVDIFTRLVACAYHLWEKSYGVEFTKQHANLFLLIKWIPNAYRFRLVNSMALRTGFVSKLMCYMLLIITASVCDIVLPVRFMLVLVTSVLTCTEMLSVCENLSESNISVASDLRNLVKKRKEGIK